jgi:hypothetical protein
VSDCVYGATLHSRESSMTGRVSIPMRECLSVMFECAYRFQPEVAGCRGKRECVNWTRA